MCKRPITSMSTSSPSGHPPSLMSNVREIPQLFLVEGEHFVTLFEVWVM